MGIKIKLPKPLKMPSIKTLPKIQLPKPATIPALILPKPIIKTITALPLKTIIIPKPKIQPLIIVKPKGIIIPKPKGIVKLPAPVIPIVKINLPLPTIPASKISLPTVKSLPLPAPIVIPKIKVLQLPRPIVKIPVVNLPKPVFPTIKSIEKAIITATVSIKQTIDKQVIQPITTKVIQPITTLPKIIDTKVIQPISVGIKSIAPPQQPSNTLYDEPIYYTDDRLTYWVDYGDGDIVLYIPEGLEDGYYEDEDGSFYEKDRMGFRKYIAV